MRKSGILMHISSLPGPGGIGSLGAESYAFADDLAAAGISLWQVLPCGPTGYGESPYQSSSVFAGNPLFISVEKLAAEGLLSAAPQYPDFQPDRVDYEEVRKIKMAALRQAYRESGEKLQDKIGAFVRENAWLPDFALFTALKDKFGGIKWSEWPDPDLRLRKRSALAAARGELSEEIGFQEFVQYLFFRQWDDLKTYCHQKGIELFGDMPIYVAEDSADTWTRPDIFQLDRSRIPKRVAGVPPDAFSEDGQRWGNPLYRWNWLRFVCRYDWWIARMKEMKKLYDWVRIDHFIGFANYWSVPYQDKTARNGKWVVGPGKSLFRQLERKVSGLHIVAEDLGVISDRVRELLKSTGYPGMRILMYGFGGNPSENCHHPSQLTENLIIYTGNHDNDTLRSWFEHATPDELRNARETLHFDTVEEGMKAFIRCCYESPCDTCILPMQDILGLGGAARMNLPGTIGGNWEWRMLPDAFTEEKIKQLRRLNESSGRMR